MVTASYENREYGHTGQGFSYLWGGLGADTGGPDAAAAFFKEASWHFDLVRRCDGSFTYDGDEQYGPGHTEDDTYYGDSSYYGLSPTASYVLTYSLPLKKLCITGSGANRANWLSKKDVAEAIASGRFDVDRKEMTTKQIVAAFGDWSPIVRGWAAEELAKRPEAKAMVPQLIALAEGPDAHVRQGACEALGYIKSADALPVLVRLLTHEDRWLRVKAANALKNMGDAAKPVVPAMLKAVAQTAEPIQPIVWDDPIQLTHGELAAALFQGLLRDSVEGVDPELLYPAIRAISRNADGMARATLRDILENRLSVEDVQALGPDILAAVKTRCPADTMFGNEIRMGGFKALTKYHFQEGIEAGVIFAKTQGGHGSESRTGEIMKELMSYGTAAREAVPGLKEVIVQFNAQCKKGEFPAGELNDRRVTAVEEAIQAIEAATMQPELRSIEPVRPKGSSEIGMWATSASAMTFVHPGALDSKAELDFVKAKIQAGAQPWKGEFDRIKSSSSATRGPHGLTTINSQNNDAEISRDDAIAAYTQAILWCFTDDETYAKRSIAILNSWTDLQTFTAGSDQDRLQAGWIGAVLRRRLKSCDFIRDGRQRRSGIFKRCSNGLSIPN